VAAPTEKVAARGCAAADENTAALPLKTHFSGNRCSAAGSHFLKNTALWCDDRQRSDATQTRRRRHHVRHYHRTSSACIDTHL